MMQAGTAGGIVLYDALNSPACRRVRMTLLEKGLDFEIRWTNLGLLDQKRPAYLALNPSGLVPTLVHDGRILFESNAINEYLDAIFPDPALVPQSPLQQAQMRMWMAYELEWAKPFRDAIYETYARERLRNSGVTPESLPDLVRARTTNSAYLNMALQLLTTPRNEALLADRVEILFERMSWMENQLRDQRQWLLGDRFSLADIALAPRIAMFPLIGVDDLYQRFPLIGAFMARIAARPSWRDSDLRPEAGEERSSVQGRGR
jgi:glutathione S-transferase